MQPSLFELKTKQQSLIKELEELPAKKKHSSYRRRGVEILAELQDLQHIAKKMNINL